MILFYGVKDGVEKSVDNDVDDGDDDCVDDSDRGADKHLTNLSQGVDFHLTWRSKQNKHFSGDKDNYVNNGNKGNDDISFEDGINESNVGTDKQSTLLFFKGLIVI
eukprot:15354495-Ditylum_brightwellii.AAC.1